MDDELPLFVIGSKPIFRNAKSVFHYISSVTSY